MNRTEHLQRATEQDFDLCIIGGGASGAGCALDAALRGLRVLLVERDDFANATSSRSTKLIHGGVRYLEQAFKNLDFGQLRQVRHGLEERHIVLTNAPHLAQPLALVTPVFSWLEGLYFSIGLRLYDFFASKKDTLPGSQWLSRADTLQRIPTLSPRMHSSVLYYDGQLDDARYALALVQSAAEAGATVLNYAQVIDFQKNNHTQQLESATVEDRATGRRLRIGARVFLNCCGPYADHIRLMANPARQARIRPSKGVHAVLPAEVLGGRDALLIPKTPDGRVVFAIPFGGQTLLGTTDTEYDSLEREPTLERAELDFLLETLDRYLAQPTDRSRVKAGFGGLRPLIAAADTGTKKATKGLLRDHEVERDAESGLLSLLGGKWTTYRLMAADAVDAACAQLGVSAPCATAQHRLVGGEQWQADGWQQWVGQSGWSAATARHLHHNYGTRAERVAALAQNEPRWAEPIHPNYPYVLAEVMYAAREEMCLTIRDFLARRTRLEICDWSAAIESAASVATLLGAELGWNDQKIMTQTLEYQQLIQSFAQSASG
jgi:glycerol-3-phosphate dehydrogenase